MENSASLAHHVVLFADVHNFSRALPRLAKGLHTFLQEIYERLGDTIVAHQGEIIKYMGDALLCVFPAGHEVDAVRCALEMRQIFAGLVDSRELPPDTELEVGIGSGQVAVGVFGHSTLQQKDVFGEEVNRAATIGHHRGIAITEHVYDKVKRTYETRRLPDVPVKWQEEPLRVWEVLESGPQGSTG